MSRLVLSACLAFAFPTLAFAADEDAFDGTWTIVTAELGGMKLPEEFSKNVKLVMKGNEYTVTANGITEKGTVKTDKTAKPITVDILAADGPNKGKTILAICEVNGDTMKACYDLEGKMRPKEFASKADTQLFLVTYKKEKK